MALPSVFRDQDNPEQHNIQVRRDAAQIVALVLTGLGFDADLETAAQDVRRTLERNRSC